MTRLKRLVQADDVNPCKVRLQPTPGPTAAIAGPSRGTSCRLASSAREEGRCAARLARGRHYRRNTRCSSPPRPSACVQVALSARAYATSRPAGTPDAGREVSVVTRPALAGRLRWRVVVRTEGHLDPSRATRPLAWHLVGCPAEAQVDAHCAEGRRLLLAGGDPEGHCLIEGTCPRCLQAAP
jgi:hypothetical protein